MSDINRTLIAPTSLTRGIYVPCSPERLLGKYWLINILASFCRISSNPLRHQSCGTGPGKFWVNCRKHVEIETHLESQDLNGCLGKLRGPRKVVLRMRFSRSSRMWWGIFDLFKIKTEVFLRASSVKNNFHEFKMHHREDPSQSILRPWEHNKFFSVPSWLTLTII